MCVYYICIYKRASCMQLFWRPFTHDSCSICCQDWNQYVCTSKLCVYIYIYIYIHTHIQIHIGFVGCITCFMHLFSLVCGSCGVSRYVKNVTTVESLCTIYMCVCMYVCMYALYVCMYMIYKMPCSI
jgi:hypothetical protein